MAIFSCNNLNLCFDPLSVANKVLQINFCKLFANNPSKEICTFLVFVNYTSGYFLNNFANIFTITRFCQNLAFFFANSKSRAQELSNDV